MTANGSGKDEWFKKYKDNVVKFPTKESDLHDKFTAEHRKATIVDLASGGLELLEKEAVELFPKEEDQIGKLHLSLLAALPFMMLCNGWEKGDILETFTEVLDDSKDLFDELEESDE